jgi:hypothetical protein
MISPPKSAIPSIEERLRELSPVLEALRRRLVSELGQEDIPDSKVLWKTLALYQCLIRRTLELTDGIIGAWYRNSYLIAVVIARSLVETAAFTYDITVRIEKHIKDNDLSAVDKLIMDRTFATKMPDWVNNGLPSDAKNIMGLLRDLDRAVGPAPGDEQKPVEGHYALLSEFTHPNWLGVTHLYGEIVQEQCLIRFGKPGDADRLRISQVLGVSVESVNVIDACARKLDQLEGPLRDLIQPARA